jgi:hypothetical protein
MNILKPDADSRVAVEIVVSELQRVLDVWTLSPARRCTYRIGDDPRRCDFVMPLGPGRTAVLFEIHDDRIVAREFKDERFRVATSGDAKRLSVAVGDTVFEARWCDEPALVATWADFDETIAGDHYSVKCSVRMPIRGRCPSCRSAIEGSFVAHGSSKDDAVSIASTRARTSALGEARAEAALARCPHCGRRASRGLFWFVAQCTAGLALLVGVPASIAASMRDGHWRISGSILLVPILGAGLLANAVAKWRGAAGIRLRDASGGPLQAGAMTPYRTASATARTRLEWEECVDADGTQILAFSGINVDEQARLAGEAKRPFFGRLTRMVAGPAALAVFAAFLAVLVAGVLVTVGTFLTVAIVAVIAGRLRAIGEDRNAARRGRFILRLSPRGFDALGPGIGPLRPRFPLESIARFEGGERLAVRRHPDQTLANLPCRIESGRHEALVARLNELLEAARAEASGKARQTGE